MNPTPLSRREFLAATGASLGAMTHTAARGASFESRDPDEWAFILLGDLHFDRPEHHDLRWVEREHPASVAQIGQYCDVTARWTPRLLDEVRQTVRDSPVPVKLIVQVGDLVQGLCGRPDLASLQARDAVAALEASQFDVPFLLTKGNHDITGPGAPEAYDAVMLPFLRRESRRDLPGASFEYELADRWFLFFDAYDRKSLDWLEATANRDPDRPFFLVIHPPVVPYNARSNWHLYASEDQNPLRTRLLALLGRHRAIVLGGHLHKYASVTRRAAPGRLHQLAVSSVLRSEVDQPQDVRQGLPDYGPDLVELEPAFSPDTRELRRHLLSAERPQIEQFDFANTAGYAVVRVSRSSVKADVYTGLGRRLWKTVDLTPA